MRGLALGSHDKPISGDTTPLYVGSSEKLEGGVVEQCNDDVANNVHTKAR
jgi:hypothetical protein